MPKLKSGVDVSAEGDMTAMIDMTFQLIAFFMILINFADAENNKEIKLPPSRLAIPPETPPESPVVLQMDKEGKVLYSADGFEPMALVRKRLVVKRDFLKREKKNDDAAKDATVIIRADRDTPSKFVREMLEMCQELGFEKFAFRAASISD
ncbi:MAG: biopolymer transporter ExbD [Planctomycetaceae bacterium]|nr:biopolymer transporter ExbD [Planctomycetaceae bacterium]